MTIQIKIVRSKSESESAALKFKFEPILVYRKILLILRHVLNRIKQQFSLEQIEKCICEINS